HKAVLNRLLKAYENPDIFYQVLRRNFEAKFGTANPFVFWYEDLINQLELIISKVSHLQILEIVKEICKNPKENSTGFPDLFVYNGLDFFFAEVKSENDHLSNKQLHWIHFMQKLAVPVKIIRPVVTF
ncbi:MAG: VRR-NUC domain-containing protein, partial [Bacteroidetes bacterium]|nr:VRR-NUC domain-containing protein [Bacteroidota bacterium]